MRMGKAIGLVLSLLAMPALAVPASGQKPAQPSPAMPPRTAGSAMPSPPTPAPLTKGDVDTFLDGFVPYAIAQGDIAGAVVVVVKDAKVLTQRGFGYADIASHRPVDPETTMFRPGSTSKLFTWTSVMQLVQAGKLDLDTDINKYLDFTIPPAFGKPITLRDLMTHTSGLEETAKYLIFYNPNQLRPLDQVLKRWVPGRIYPPGTMPAYSNYGCSLAGYIVQRVSGEPFDAYVKHHILDPLGMKHASFTQPLPADLAADMATGYPQASVKPLGYEMISLSPAGSMAASGGDMARFMIAHLGNTVPELSPATTALMHAPANTPIAGLPPMALGFYHEDRGGLNIIGHAGDLNYFHSDLHLYLDKGVGMFMSFNSAGKGGAAHTVRTALFDAFTDRYFPAAPAEMPTAASAHADGALVAGTYTSSRASRSNFMRFINLVSDTKVVLNPDDTITVAALANAAGVPKHWREVGRFMWQEVGGSDRLGAKVVDGKVIMLAPAAFAPIIEFVPASWDMNSSWILPVMGLAMLVMLLTALSWPIVALVRRRYRASLVWEGRALPLYRATRADAWLWLAFATGWALLIMKMVSDTASFDGRLDPWLRLVQLIGVAAILGTAVAVWNAAAVWQRPGRHRFATVWSIIVALAGLFLAWLAFDVRLLTLALNY